MQQQTMPEIVVQKLEGECEIPIREYVIDKELSTPEKKRYKMKDGFKKVPAGYLLMFPRKGHSIRVDEEEFQRQKARLNDPNGIVESESMANMDMSAVLRSANGNSLVTVIQSGGK